MMRNCVKPALIAGLVLASSLVPAEDIDLFMGVQHRVDTASNVLFVIDNSGNWSTAFAAEIDALVAGIDVLAGDNIRLGFMMYTEAGAGNASPDGAYVRAAVRAMDSEAKPLYQYLVSSLDRNADRSNVAKLGLTMSEVHRYFSGAQAYAGHNKAKRDYRGNSISGLTASNAIYSLPGNAFASAADRTYERPVNADECQKNFVILVSNGQSDVNANDNGTAEVHLRAVGGETAQVPLVPSGYQGDVADEWSRYLANKAASPVITYVIDVVPTQDGQYSRDYQALLMSMATQGKGKYFNVGSAAAGDIGAKIQVALGTIFGEIAAVNSVFSAASLPVSVNTQGVYLNQVFIGMFRPDKGRAPGWVGNLKQYQLGVDSSAALQLVDRTGARAINPLTGSVTPCAVSYWTPGAVDTYWSFKRGEFATPCRTVPGADASNYPDGDAVEKGGSGYRVRATAPGVRSVKTCTGACDVLADFNESNGDVTAAALGVAAADRSSLINWVRGQDLLDENRDGDTTQMRPSAHGDVIHSRPLAVDYGGGTTVVFYGGNDGMLRAVEGGKDMADGDELWSFVAPEHFGRLKRLWINAPLIDFPAPPPGQGNHKDYFFDGSVGGFRTSAGRVWIYATMRRGGRQVYAFDVSTAAAPSLMWRRGCPNPHDDIGCDTGLSGIGETWSAVQVFLAAGYLDAATPQTPKPIAIFGGGYDSCEDLEPNSCATPKGNHLYVVDAQSGALLKTFDTIRSVAADISVIDGNADGKGELAYAVDAGGNLYRLNIGDAPPRDWTITQVAALGCDAPPCVAFGAYNRKFLYAPEVVVTSRYNTILVGSGDREHPKAPPEGKDVNDGFFVVMDKPGDATWLAVESTNCGGAGLICKASLLEILPEGANPTAVQLSAKKGWYLAFGTDAGGVVHDDEQVVTSAIVIGGVVYFSTYTPTASTQEPCGPNLGTARAYAVNFLTAASPDGTTTRFGELTGGGLAPSPVGGIVAIGGKLYPFVIGGRQLAGGASAGIEAQNAGSVMSGARILTHWYIEPPAPQ